MVQYIESENLLACVDALVKGRFMGGHIVIKDMLEELIDKFSICTNQWNGSIYKAEARIMLEAYVFIKDIPCKDNLGKLVILTDNIWLQRILVKPTLTHTDMTHDSGTII